MGLFGNLAGKKEQEETQEAEPEGKYDEVCSICGKGGTEKKWGGQYWHRRCLKSAKRMAKGMI